MSKLELDVIGMHCGGCENRIKNALSELKIIKNVEANHETGKVNIELKKEGNEETLSEIKKIIERLDFEVK